MATLKTVQTETTYVLTLNEKELGYFKSLVGGSTTSNDADLGMSNTEASALYNVLLGF